VNFHKVVEYLNLNDFQNKQITIVVLMGKDCD